MMFVIRIMGEGYYCGGYRLGGSLYLACGVYDADDPHVKKYKKRESAEKTINTLNSRYDGDYYFKIVEVK